MKSDSAFCIPLQSLMHQSGADIYCVDCFAEALDAISRYEYSLAILVLQQVDGGVLEAVYRVREAKPMPIIAITNTIKPEQKIELFRTGIHVHIETPIDIELCVTQANSLMELYDAGKDLRCRSELAFGPELVIQLRFRRVFVHGQPLKLTRKEFDLLYYLAQFPYQVFSYEQLYSHVWKDDLGIGGENTVKVHIVTLRKKLRTIEKDCIQNVWGIGYRFVPPNSEITAL